MNQQSTHLYTIEIRFYGDDLVPSEITKKLGLRPSNTSEILALRSSKRSGRPFWAYNAHQEYGFKPEWDDLEKGLSFLLESLSAVREIIIELSQRFDGVWWCGHFQMSFDGGPILSANILKEISSYELPLSIDNYFSGDR